MRTIIRVFTGLLLVTSTGSNLFSQTISEKTREIYISANSLKDWSYGFQFKSSLPKENTYIRMSIMNINTSYKELTYNISTQYPKKDFSLNVQFQGGIEKRFDYKKIDLFSGVDIFTAVGYINSRAENPTIPAEQRNSKRNILSAGFAFTSGVIYRISDFLSFGADINPVLAFDHMTTEQYISGELRKQTNSGPSFDFAIDNIRFSLILKLATSR